MNEIIYTKEVIIDEKPYTTKAYKTLNGVDIVFYENEINIFKESISEKEYNVTDMFIHQYGNDFAFEKLIDSVKRSFILKIKGEVQPTN